MLEHENVFRANQWAIHRWVSQTKSVIASALTYSSFTLSKGLDGIRFKIREERKPVMTEEMNLILRWSTERKKNTWKMGIKIFEVEKQRGNYISRLASSLSRADHQNWLSLENESAFDDFRLANWSIFSAMRLNALLKWRRIAAL